MIFTGFYCWKFWSGFKEFAVFNTDEGLATLKNPELLQINGIQHPLQCKEDLAYTGLRMESY